jgi:Ca2+-dependent lipid-binding protein
MIIIIKHYININIKMDFNMQGGTLKIHIEAATNLKEDDLFDKLDPVCRVSWKDSKTN